MVDRPALKIAITNTIMSQSSSEPPPKKTGPSHPSRDHKKRMGLLTLTALGVVFGDIGTSPLYAVRECFHGPHAIGTLPQNIFGVLSLIFWSLITVVTVKYLFYVLMHPENNIKDHSNNCDLVIVIVTIMLYPFEG